MSLTKAQTDLLDRLRQVLDRPGGSYKKLNGAKNFNEYLDRTAPREDEEILTEPMLADLMQTVLGFPSDSYFPQLGRSGLKPDFTPHDLIAHPFVLDAKSSTQKLPPHEKQIRAYIDQRQLDRGVLFNLREIRVYPRGKTGHEPELSFDLLPLWLVARGEAMPTEEVERLDAFAARFAYREMGLPEKIGAIRTAEPWDQKEAHGESPTVDVDFLINRLRALTDDLIADAGAQRDELERHLSLNPGREAFLVGELEAIAQDVSPGTDPASLPDSVAGYIDGDPLTSRIWRQYLLRVAQLALARILLYRAWEDVGFVDQHLYDGGFGQVYDKLDENLREVLDEAFVRGGQRYRWLYGPDNNYDWFRPRDDALAEVLYALSPVPLGKLDADVLGSLYASYVDEIDRDRLGQFYTPRAVVKFMLDRAGFSEPDGVFKVEANRRKPVRVFDFATGSGGFLVEAARRIIDEGGVDENDRKGLDESLAAVVAGFHGCEISPFPYYLTEINLLLQVSRLLGRLRLAGSAPQSFVLGVVHADTLTARDVGRASIEGMDPEARTDEAELVEDKRFGLVGLDAEKREAFARIRENETFDLVIGNPPYVFETGNKILFDRLRSIPAWKDVYKGKSDYLYYFLWLAAEKVAPDGKLCVITPAGWMNAGNADWLRERLADVLRLDELFLFGGYPLFTPDRESGAKEYKAPTPTVESAILIATKAKAAKNHRLRVVALEDEREAAVKLTGSGEARSPGRDDLLGEMGKRISGKPGRRNGIHFHRVAQVDLAAAPPWPIKHGAEDVPTRAVADLQKSLDDDEIPIERLGKRWSTPQGIQTGADAYTPRIEKRLRDSFPDAKRELDHSGAELGEPILELPPGRDTEAPWKSHPELLARSIEPQAILYAALDEDNYTHLVWLGRDDEAPKAVVAALEKWRPVLENRAEFRRNLKRRWWECAWPRDGEELRKPKVIALYRTDRGRFALDEDGSWQPSIKTTLVIPKQDGLSVAYCCGLLNSELLDVWYGVRGKTPRDVWRNYEPKPMAEIPYRHLDLSVQVDDSRLVLIEKAIGDGNTDHVLDVSDRIGMDLRKAPDGGRSPDSREAAEAGRALEVIVRAVATNRQQLLPFRSRFPALDRIVKDPWSVGPVTVDQGAAITALAEKDLVSLRTDPKLTVSINSDGTLGKARQADDGLELVHSRKRTALIEGPEERLALIEILLAAQKKVLASDMESTLLPRDLERFRSTLAKEQEKVEVLLHRGRALVEAAERLVCRLYGLPPELEDEVVAHAFARAGTSIAADPDEDGA